VVGAVLQLGNCCDFLDSKYTAWVASFYPVMEEDHRTSGKQLPKNIDSTEDHYGDKLVRLLDGAVIEYMNKIICLFNCNTHYWL
jgi:hypothetical protein